MRQPQAFRIILATTLGYLICVFTGYAQKKEDKPEWVFLSTDNHGWKNFYDSKSVVRTPDGIVKVQAKQVPMYKDEEDKKVRMQRLLENRKWLGIKTDGYDNYAYSVTIIEINCVINEGRSSTMIDYDSSDKELAKSTLSDVEWAPISPRSWLMGLVPKVCEPKK